MDGWNRLEHILSLFWPLPNSVLYWNEQYFQPFITCFIKTYKTTYYYLEPDFPSE